MAGVYLHIPFCKQACHYCDFHFSVNQSRKQEVVSAIIKEIELQKQYLGSEPIETLYFGGGTPSLLNEEEITNIMQSLSSHLNMENVREITFEANPDDLSLAKLETLRRTGINRLSIGIQSFNDKVLSYLNRAHNGDEAIQSIQNAQKVGFDNFSIDLIYAIPAPDHTNWLSDLKKAIEIQPKHISSYSLTIEPQTAFGRRYKRGDLKIANEDFAAQQFEILVETLAKNGYEQYEISNFSRDGYHSMHNSSYWKQKKYLGLGPSAHSYNGTSRQFNISHNQKYLQSISQSLVPFELDPLTREDQINEYILTTLRTIWGIDLDKLSREMNFDLMNYHENYIYRLVTQDYLIRTDQFLKLTDKGKLLADKIASDLFIG